MSAQLDDIWRGGATCKVDGTITQITAAPTPIGIAISCQIGSEFEILSIRLSMGTVAAARVVNVSHVTSADAEVLQFIAVTLDSNQVYRGPIQTVILDDQVADTPQSAVGLPYTPYMISGGEKIRITLLSAADTEVLTIKIRLRVRGAMPNFAAIGASISVATFTATVI